MRELYLTWATVALIAVACPSAARAWCQSYSVEQFTPGQCQTEGIPLRWDRPCIGYGVDARGGRTIDFSEFVAVSRTSFEAWTEVNCGAGSDPGLSILPYEEPSLCNLAEFNERGRNVNTIAFVNDWSSRTNAMGEPLDPGAIALTVVWFPRSGLILDADILINEAQGPFATCLASGCIGPDANAADLESILTHEVGHFIGIAHSEVPTATMVATYPRGSIDNRTLEVDDQQAVCTIYAPGTLGTVCNYEPLTGLELNCEPDVLVGNCATAHGRTPSRNTPAGAAVLTALVAIVSCRYLLR